MQRRFDVALPPTPVIGFAAPFVPQSTTRDSKWQVPAMRSCLFVMTRACYRDQSPKGIYRGESKAVSGRDKFPGGVRVNPFADRGSRKTSTQENMPRSTGSTVRATRLQGLGGSDTRGTDRSGSASSTGRTHRTRAPARSLRSDFTRGMGQSACLRKTMVPERSPGWHVLRLAIWPLRLPLGECPDYL